jgi:hypothetical protein
MNTVKITIPFVYEAQAKAPGQRKEMMGRKSEATQC